MNIAESIRKYRKASGLTQEEMAKRLGVTTPAVSKWENGIANPDIALLAPIARLFHISVDTLLSYREQLSDDEINAIVQKINDMFATEDFATVYEWAERKIKEYPSCNKLIWNVAIVLEARLIVDDKTDGELYEPQIYAWYEQALEDEDEDIRHKATDALFGFSMRKKDYAKAEEYLAHFSDFDPVKKLNMGRWHMEQGEQENAYKLFEEVIFSEYNRSLLALAYMVGMALEKKEYEKARYYAKKQGEIACAFEMGIYQQCSPMLEIVCAQKDVKGTCHVVEQLLNHVESLYDFTKAELYEHVTFRKPDETYVKEVRESLLEGFRDEETFGYMKGCKEWEQLIETEEDNWLLSEVNKRLENNGEKNAVSFDDVMDHLGISESEIGEGVTSVK